MKTSLKSKGLNLTKTKITILITQKQLNQVFAGKDIDLKVQQNEWILNKSLTKDQIRKIGLIPLKVHHHGRIEESEVVEILTVG